MKSAWLYLVGAAVLIIAGIFIFQDKDQAQSTRSPTLVDTGSGQGVEIYTSDPVAPTISQAVRDLPDYKPEASINKEINERQTLGIELNLNDLIPGKVDPLLSLQEFLPRNQEDAGFLTPILNFSGHYDTGVDPPDTEGDVGLTQYVQAVNGSGGGVFTVYSKVDGSILAGPYAMHQLADVSSNCSSGWGDVIVLYDQLADRWLMSEFAQVGNHLCVYISQTGDPAGSWYSYDFTIVRFPDYPKFAVWPDAYYATTNESDGAAVYAFDRTKMLAGQAVTYQRFVAPKLDGFSYFNAFTPSELDGALSPPAGSPNYMIRHNDDEFNDPGSNDPSQDFLELWEFHVDFNNSANSSFTGPSYVPITEIDSSLCQSNPFNCFAQPGTTRKLDAVKEVVMWRLQYRNFSSYETLVGNFVHDVDGSDHGGIRWFELRKAGADPWELYQEGTFAPDSNHRWMGSIAMDGSGDIALGYSVASSSVYPSIRYAGRMSSDLLGNLTSGEGTILAGTGYQNTNRWGDYSSMHIDPADDCTFWYTNMASDSSHNWSTQIATFKFSSCGFNGGERIFLPLVFRSGG